MLTETATGNTTEVEQLRQENEQLRTRLKKVANTRAVFRNQALREMVTPPHRDQQQHEAKRTAYGAYNEQTDTMVETIFCRLGEASRKLSSAAFAAADDFVLNGAIAEMNAVMDEIETRAAQSGKIVWCKACGEVMQDCRCKVPKPREG